MTEFEQLKKVLNRIGLQHSIAGPDDVVPSLVWIAVDSPDTESTCAGKILFSFDAATGELSSLAINKPSELQAWEVSKQHDRLVDVRPEVAALPAIPPRAGEPQC